MIQRIRPGFAIARTLIPVLEKASGGSGLHIEIPEKPVALTSEEAPLKTQPDLVVRDSNTRSILLVVDIDIRSCGRNEDFAKKIRLYDRANIQEHWLVVPSDGIVVVRKDPDFKKPSVYEPTDALSPHSFSAKQIPVSVILGLQGIF